MNQLSIVDCAWWVFPIYGTSHEEYCIEAEEVIGGAVTREL